MANGPHTFECTSSNGFVVRLVLTLMIFCLCLARMHAVHIESSFVYPSIRDRRVVGLMWARRRCHSLDSEIMRGFRVGFGNSVVDGHRFMVLAALGEAVWSGLVVGSVECAIDGTVVCVLDDALFLFFFLLLEVDFIDMLGTVDVSAVVGDMI